MTPGNLKISHYLGLGRGRAKAVLRAISLGVLAVAIVALYWHGAMKQFSRNSDMRSSDQSAYMDYARSMYETNYDYFGGRARMPLYPFIQSLFLADGVTDEEFFKQGKLLNIGLSVALLFSLALIFSQFLSLWSTVNLLLVVAFLVFMFKAPWFQAELLFYFINFCAFLFFWRLLNQPSMRWSIVAGVVTGLAHLTKASILPGLGVFVGCAVAKAVWKHLSGNRTRSYAEGLMPIISVSLVVVSFLLIVAPYIVNSKRVFGSYFYNVNSTFYMWYDSWEEVERGTKAYGDRLTWPQMPPEEIPAMSKYIKEHTLSQIMHRFIDGGRRIIGKVISSYGYFNYIVIYSGVFVVLLIMRSRKAWEYVSSHAFVILFLVSYFAAYIALYSWFAALNPGNRFILALFIPLMFSLSLGSQELMGTGLRDRNCRLTYSTLVNMIISALLAWDIYFVLTERAGKVYGGS